MNDWYHKNLGDGMLAWEPLQQIEALLQQAQAESDMPQQMAVFVRHESVGGLHCEVQVYFSPAAQNIARRFEASPCPKPLHRGLSLLAGAEEAWQILFPERG